MWKILIIDDHRSALETLSDVLQEEGYHIVCAETGVAGLDCFKKESFQVVLLDLKLPDRNGLDVLKEIIESNPEQRVVVITGYATVETAIVALNLGAHAYTTKPFNMETVKATIKQAIQQHELVAKKKEVDEEVRRLKEYNESILASLPYAIVIFSVIIFDQSRKVEYVNPVFLNDFNLEKEGVISRNIFEVLPFADSQKERIKIDVEHFLSGKPVNPLEVTIDQRIFGYRLFTVSKGVGEGQKTGLILRDITLEKKLQQQLIQSEKLAGIGTMAMGIAHELNNPLFGIMGMAEAILDEGDPLLVKEYARDIINYSKTAAATVRGLTAYSRSTEKGDMGLLDVNERLNDAIKIVKHSIEFDGIEIINNYKANKKVMINSGELQQVFVNIIHNAAQAMNGRGGLLLSTEANDESVVVKINDSGPGISKDHIGRIFDPFFTTKDPDQGTGLGLTIVYRIVQKYNGSISVESEEGKGATFMITFPIGENPTTKEVRHGISNLSCR
jgi:two-component system, NtrC family, sensor kinase